MQTVKTFEKKSSAKLMEAYLTAQQIVEHQNDKLTNGQIDGFRLFVNTYLKEIKKGS